MCVVCVHACDMGDDSARRKERLRLRARAHNANGKWYCLWPLSLSRRFSFATTARFRCARARVSPLHIRRRVFACVCVSYPTSGCNLADLHRKALQAACERKCAYNCASSTRARVDVSSASKCAHDDDDDKFAGCKGCTAAMAAKVDT